MASTRPATDIAYLCRALKAPSLAHSFERLAERARTDSWTHEEFLAACLEREVAARQDHGGEGRIRAARFPARKTLEDFDFSFQRSLKRDVVAHLGTLDFVAERANVVFLGPPGTGKTTVAGLVGGIYAALGLLSSGHVVACRPVHLAGRDAVDTDNRVAAMVEQAMGGVLLIQEAYRLDRVPQVVEELQRQLADCGDRLLMICTSPAAEMEGFLAGHPSFRAHFARTLEFQGLDDRQLVQLFQSYAERDLYLLDEELRVELLTRFERMRQDPSFAYARTVRQMFEQTVARQAARLAGMDVNAATVARLTVRDLPESPLERMLGNFQRDPRG